MYENLMQLKHYPRDEVIDLSLTMSVATDVFGVQQTIQLVPNGADVDVTGDNRLIYIANFADYMLNKRTAAQTQAFIKGLRKVIPAELLTYFYPHEIQLLITGGLNEIDI